MKNSARKVLLVLVYASSLVGKMTRANHLAKQSKSRSYFRQSFENCFNSRIITMSLFCSIQLKRMEKF